MYFFVECFDNKKLQVHLVRLVPFKEYQFFLFNILHSVNDLLLFLLSQVGARALEAGVWGAYHNIMINVADIKDGDFKKKVRCQQGASFLTLSSLYM